MVRFTDPPWLATMDNCAPSATSTRPVAVCVTTSCVKAICRSAGVRLPISARPGNWNLAALLASITRVPPVTVLSPVSETAPASIRPPPPALSVPSTRSRNTVPSLPAPRWMAPVALIDRLLPHRLPALTASICVAVKVTAAPPVALTAPLRFSAPVLVSRDAMATVPSASTDFTVSSPARISRAPVATATSLVSDRFSLPALANSPRLTSVRPR